MSAHSEGHYEAVRGLPGKLPPGERILWQGAPEWKRLALDAFHLKGVGFYFALILGWAALSGAGAAGLLATMGAGLAALGLLAGIAWASARSTVYTLTNRRIVLRIGIALPTCINVPLKIIGEAGVKLNADGTADLPLALTGPRRMGWAVLWPHARPWRLATPEPMLRAVPDGATVAALVARALAEAVPEGRRAAVEAVPAPTRPLGEVQAA